MAVDTVIGRDPWSGDILHLEYADGRITTITRQQTPDAPEPHALGVGGAKAAGRGAGDPDMVEVRGAEAAGGVASAGVPWVSRGLVDLQVNGWAGFDLNGDELSVDVVAGLREELRRVGVTRFVPTVITGSRDRIRRAVEVIADARRRYGEVAASIPFVHLEGPYISDQDGPRGCHDAAEVRPPDLAEVAEWQQAANGLIGLITLSPHWPGSTEFIAALVTGHAGGRGVGAGSRLRVAVGHTHATGDQIRAAVEAGATLATHLGNGAHAQLPRHPNYLWTQLAEDRLQAGFIADGHHLPADTFVAMVRAKGLDRSFLVSDSVAVGGRPPGEYVSPVGGEVELTADGRLLVRGTPYLAGAAAPLADGVAWAAGVLSLPEALTMATINPARIIDGSTSRLEPGTPIADVITFDWHPGDPTLTFR